MKFYYKSYIEHELFGTGSAYVEYDEQGAPCRQVNDHGNILLYASWDALSKRESGTCFLTDVALDFSIEYEWGYDEDRVAKGVFEEKWATAIKHYNSKLDNASPIAPTAADIRAIIFSITNDETMFKSSIPD